MPKPPRHSAAPLRQYPRYIRHYCTVCTGRGTRDIVRRRPPTICVRRGPASVSGSSAGAAASLPATRGGVISSSGVSGSIARCSHVHRRVDVGGSTWKGVQDGKPPSRLAHVLESFVLLEESDGLEPCDAPCRSIDSASGTHHVTRELASCFSRVVPGLLLASAQEAYSIAPDAAVMIQIRTAG